MILAGGGHAHLAVLADWARQPLDQTERYLVTTSRMTTYSGMLPGWIAGIYRADELAIDLAPLARKAGAQLVLAEVNGLDAAQRRLTLSTVEVLEFDLLSLATGGEIDISGLAALGERLLPVRPMGGFMCAWSRFLERKASAPEAQVAVVGGGAAGVELALAIATALRARFKQSGVALVTPEEGFLAGHAAKVKRLARAELAARGIVLHHAEATGEPKGLLLTDGTRIAADCVVAATGSRAPGWLARSGLACDADGFVSVGADLRSTSHDAIFAAGDLVQRVDRALPRSGVHAVKAGPVLAANLRAALAGGPLERYQPRRRTLYLLATGDRRAIVSWGPFAATGRIAWWLKDWIDRRFVASYTDKTPGA